MTHPSAENPLPQDLLDWTIVQALKEDQAGGDHTSLATIPADLQGRARCLIKAEGVLAGVDFARRLMQLTDSLLDFRPLLADGMTVHHGDEAFHVYGPVRSLLLAERLCLNTMQRMSGIATLTRQALALLEGTHCRLLDTRKTTPLIRVLEKWAVRIGGGQNHRFGLYDMVLIKDNHIDACGGLPQALASVQDYLNQTGLQLDVVVEARTLDDVLLLAAQPVVLRILLDNMSTAQMAECVQKVAGSKPLEASGGIGLHNLREVALTGVDYASLGALTHSAPNLDISFKIF